MASGRGFRQNADSSEGAGPADESAEPPLTLQDLPRRHRPSPFEWVCEALATAGILFAAGSLILSWSNLPTEIPRHFNSEGQIDAAGSPDLLLVLLLVVAIFYVGLRLLVRYPRVMNFPFPLTTENAQRQYDLIRKFILSLRVVTVWLFAYLIWASLEVAFGRMDGLGIAFLPTVIAGCVVPFALYLFLAIRAR